MYAEVIVNTRIFRELATSLFASLLTNYPNICCIFF